MDYSYLMGTTSDDNSRIFDPRQNLRGSNKTHLQHPSELLHHDSAAGTTKLIYHVMATPEPRIDKFSVVVAIDGACSENGQPTARASYGVFFAPSSSLNRKGLVPTTFRQTNQVAELYALSQALQAIQDTFEQNMSISTVVILTDSSYLVNGLAIHVDGWESNGWVDTRGRPITNGELFQDLHEKIVNMAEDGMDVSFWQVERGWNQDADRLASEALDG